MKFKFNNFFIHLNQYFTKKINYFYNIKIINENIIIFIRKNC